MNVDLVEKCAEALWMEYIRNPANRYHLNKLFKYPHDLTWKDACDPDVIPMFADQFRTRARMVITALRKWVASNSNTQEQMLELFMSSTMNGDYEPAVSQEEFERTKAAMDHLKHNYDE